MPEYRRAYVPGGTFFFTLVTHRRRPLFAVGANVALLRRAMAEVRAELPFEILAAVILLDHLHLMLALPEGDSDYSKRIGRIKRRFTQLLGEDPEDKPEPRQPSRVAKRESDIWQRRFWEHVIRDEADFNHHLNYIHFNPVKHGLASCPHAWEASSFKHWVAKGAYSADWCCACGGQKVVVPYPDALDQSVGE